MIDNYLWGVVIVILIACVVAAFRKAMLFLSAGWDDLLPEDLGLFLEEEEE
jgi:hypothetical protein